MDLVSEFPVITSLDEVDFEKLPPVLRIIFENLDLEDDDVAASFQSGL